MPKAYEYEYDEMGLDFQPKSKDYDEMPVSGCKIDMQIDGKFFYGTVRYGTAGGRKLPGSHAYSQCRKNTGI